MQKEKEYLNISKINLNNCENILKNHYNIDDSIPLLIFKVDYYKDGFSIPIVGYEVYDPQTNKKLNLTYCQNEIIDIESYKIYNIEKRTSYPLGNDVTIYFIQFSKPLSGEFIYLSLIAEDDVELSSYKAETLEDYKPFEKIFEYAYRDAKRVVEDFLNKEI